MATCCPMRSTLLEKVRARAQLIFSRSSCEGLSQRTFATFICPTSSQPSHVHHLNHLRPALTPLTSPTSHLQHLHYLFNLHHLRRTCRWSISMSQMAETMAVNQMTQPVQSQLYWFLQSVQRSQPVAAVVAKSGKRCHRAVCSARRRGDATPLNNGPGCKFLGWHMQREFYPANILSSAGWQPHVHGSLRVQDVVSRGGKHPLHSNPRTEHHQRQTTRARYRSKYVCHRLSSHSCKLGLLVDVGLTTVLQLSPSGWITRRVSWVVTALACPVQIHTRLLTQKQQIACKHILSAVYKGYIILSMFFWRWTIYFLCPFWRWTIYFTVFGWMK